jgi:hypothetical protein
MSESDRVIAALRQQNALLRQLCLSMATAFTETVEHLPDDARQLAHVRHGMESVHQIIEKLTTEDEPA